MSRSSDALTPQCRAVLRGRSTEVAPLRDHVEECAFCSEWLSRRAGLQLLMAQPIPPAPELRSEGMFARLRERIIEDCEDGPVGQVLEQAMPVAPIADGDAWPEPLLGSDLAPQLDARSPAPGALDWGLVRAAVLEDIVDRSSRRLVRQRFLIGLGAAAALVLCVLLFRASESRREPPEIVFADISSLPIGLYSPMSVLRNGGIR